MMDALPHYPDVQEDWPGFLDNLAKWIKKRKSSRSSRNRLAIFVIRETREVWLGVGVYTICELFFLAGE